MPPGTGDLLLKQLVAVIDGRTTVICLHAAGQIQPVEHPFETLAGEFGGPIPPPPADPAPVADPLQVARDTAALVAKWRAAHPKQQ
jgi:hypothetical protein